MSYDASRSESTPIVMSAVLLEEIADTSEIALIHHDPVVDLLIRSLLHQEFRTACQEVNRQWGA